MNNEVRLELLMAMGEKFIAYLDFHQVEHGWFGVHEYSISVPITVTEHRIQGTVHLHLLPEQPNTARILNPWAYYVSEDFSLWLRVTNEQPFWACYLCYIGW